MGEPANQGERSKPQISGGGYIPQNTDTSGKGSGPLPPRTSSAKVAESFSAALPQGKGKIPDIAIAAGRRAAPVLRYLKKQHPHCFTVQLMWPGAPTSGLDLIAVPEHDGITPAGNIITTVGAPHRLAPETLEKAAKEWGEEFTGYPEPRIALLVGGSTKHGTFSEKEAITLAYKAEAMARSAGGSLLISTSRRTDSHILQALKHHIHVPHHLYAWTPDGPNPYLGLLALADGIIVTGDSIAMASEACGTGKPVYVFEPDACLPDKHRRFIQSLYRHGCARPLAKTFAHWDYTKLDAARTVAKMIKERLGII